MLDSALIDISLREGYQLLHFKSLPSTNDFVKQLLSGQLELAASEQVDTSLPTVVVADWQSGGRGRLGRSWHSPEGGVYLSLLWPDLLAAEAAACLPLLVALATRFALQPLIDRRILVKWPNDLLLDSGAEVQHKLAGILVELINWRAVIGIGVNVFSGVALPAGSGAAEQGAAEPNRPAYLVEHFVGGQPGVEQPGVEQLGAALPSSALPSAALATESQSEILSRIVDTIVKCNIDYLDRWQNLDKNFAAFADEYRNHMARLGESVQISNALGQMVAEGVLAGIDNSGQVIIQNGDETCGIISGDITFRCDG
ncbi:MAG: biotin--[acetyl-CoA-carboxylase] ligase [Coriobacteriia bacterium]|nr:biotin--[acetyl-CoA-carboxylase] ligase [Coriobacteriia bacterium]